MDNRTGLKPLGRAVLVEPISVKASVKSTLIHIPETAQDGIMAAEQQVTVIAVGPEAWKEEHGGKWWRILLGWNIPRAKPGDKVMVSKYAGFITTSPVDGKRYRVVNANDIFLGITM